MSNRKSTSIRQDRLDLMDVEARYESERAINAVQRARLKRLAERLNQLETEIDLFSPEMYEEIDEIKMELDLLMDMANDQHQKLRGIKGTFQKLKNFFRF